jgi:Ser/Thr protein kinase RdoA (MazF antagonist)
MQRWLPLLPADRFARLLAADGRASLENWCRGPAARADHRATIETAGGMLGALHGLIEQEVVEDHDDRWLAWCQRLDGWIEELSAAGRLRDPEGVRARLAATRPVRATWGLMHGDFCLENLVVGEDGLCCIDNVTVAPGLLQADLAQTFYRWSMTDEHREVFLEHYALHADPSDYREHATFWHVAAALQSAAWRSREGCAGIEVPLAELAQYVA